MARAGLEATFEGIDKHPIVRYIYATVMKMMAQDSAQTSQRVKVGMIGLAAVLLLIGLAAAIFSTASREKAVAGGARADVVANMAMANTVMPGDTPTDEPLAELGVAPSTAPDNVATAAEPTASSRPLIVMTMILKQRRNSLLWLRKIVT